MHFGNVESLDERVESQALFCFMVCFVLLEDKQISKFGVVITVEKPLFSYANLD